MKIVLDTNVFISGIFFTGPPYRILGAWRVDIKPFLTLVAQEGLMIAPEPLPDPVCADADDDKFIACALAAACDIVVSGDRHLLKVSGFRGISVLTPREFVRRHLEGSV